MGVDKKCLRLGLGNGLIIGIGVRSFNLFTITQEVLQFVHKVMDVLELPINRGKSYVGHTIQSMKFLHHLFPDLRAPDFPVPFLLKVELDAIDDLLDDIDADGPLLASRFQAIEDLNAIKRFSPSIFFDDCRQSLLGPLSRRKTPLAAETFPTSADGIFVLTLPRVNDFAFGVATERTLHL